MPLGPIDGSLKVVIEPIDRVPLVLFCGGGDQDPLGPPQRPQPLTQGSVVRDLLGHDVGGALERLLRSLHPFFGVHIAGGHKKRLGAVPALGEQERGQGLQTLFTGDGGAGAALLPVGTVQVLHLSQGGRGVNGGGESLSELSLPVDSGLDLAPAFFQIAQVLEAVGQGAQGGVVHGSVEFLAVAGDKGDGIPLVNELDHVFHVDGVLA